MAIPSHLRASRCLSRVRGWSWLGRSKAEAPSAAEAGPAEAHPSYEDFERLFRGELSREETRGLLAHLLPGCARCLESTARLWRVGLDDGRPRRWTAGEVGDITAAESAEYDEVFGRVFSRVRRAHDRLAGERSEARRLALELAAQPWERRRLLAENSPRFQTWGLCELLLDRSEEERVSSPPQAASWAELATAVVERIDPSVHPRASLADLQARAWGSLAEAFRLLADFDGAERAFAAAGRQLARGTGDRVEKAGLLELEALLRVDQGKAEEADRLFHRAIGLYRRAGQLQPLRRALIRRGHARICAGDPEAGIAAIQQGLAVGAPRFEVRLVRATADLMHGIAGRIRRAVR